MSSKQKIEVTKKRIVNTYASLWHSSLCLLEKGQLSPEGSFHQFMASIVFTAFTLEAYLNHIGPKLFKCWDDLERLGPKEKLNVISEHLKISVNYGIRPWQVMRNLFGFRNDIAHGKSETLKTHKIETLEKHSDKEFVEFVPTKWEKYCSEKNALRAREDIEKIIHTIHEYGQFENDYPFSSGYQFESSTIINR